MVEGGASLILLYVTLNIKCQAIRSLLWREIDDFLLYDQFNIYWAIQYSWGEIDDKDTNYESISIY